MERIDKYVWYQEGPGVRKNQYTVEGIKLLNVANLVDGNIDLSTSDRYISEEEANGKYKHFLADEGDLVIASSGIQVNYFDKKMGFIKKEHLPLCMNTSTIRFKTLDKNVTNIRYFMYFLKSDIFKRQLQKLITGSAQLNFGPSHLKKIKINMPLLENQNKAVNELDKVQEIIDTRKRQIELLDELLKSQFVEMFLKNEFPKEKLENNVEEMFIGPFGSALKNECFVEENNGYCVVYEQKHAIYKNIEDFRWVDKDKYESLKRFNVQPKDIIVSCRGTIGKTFVIPENAPLGIMHPSIMKIRLKKEKYIPEFFEMVLQHYFLEKENQTNGATIKMGIKASTLEKEDFIIPDMELQIKYLTFVKQIDKQKFEIQRSLEEIQRLQESLMNKYFG